MDNNTKELLEQMAQQLGTTSEYLWKILLKQAPLDATICLVYLVLFLITPYFIYRLHLKFLKPIKDDDYYNHYYDKYEFLTPVMIVLSSVLLFVVFIALFTLPEQILNGYLNPEYWALKQIMNTFKGC